MDIHIALSGATLAALLIFISRSGSKLKEHELMWDWYKKHILDK